MIQPNELRIGNLVYDILADVNVEVIGIDQYEIFTEDIGGVQEICNCKDIEPIPLTDEFCTKQGWEKVGYYYTDKNGLKIYETNDCWHLHIDDEKYQTALAINVMHLHELQNAYFVATKKELEIKL